MIRGSIPEFAQRGTSVILKAPMMPWRRIFTGTAADGSALTTTSIHEWMIDNPNVAKEIGTHASGRVVVNGGCFSRLELLPLFSAAGGSAAVQMWGFDAVLPQLVDSNTDGAVADLRTIGRIPASDSGLYPGVGYSLSKDSGVDTYTFAAGNDTVRLSYPSLGTPAPTAATAPIPRDTASGTQFYMGTRLIVDPAGFYMFLPYVASISSGTFALLARFS